MRAVSAGILACSLAAALAGCGSAPAGRLDADGAGATTTRPGTPVEVVNTTTTGPPSHVEPATSGPTGTGQSGSGAGSGPALGFPAGGSGAGTGQGSGSSGVTGATGASGGSGSEEAQMEAMLTCLRSKGVNVAPSSTDSTGKPVYDQAALAALSQDPKAQAAAAACATQIGIGTN